MRTARRARTNAAQTPPAFKLLYSIVFAGAARIFRRRVDRKYSLHLHRRYRRGLFFRGGVRGGDRRGWRARRDDGRRPNQSYGLLSDAAGFSGRRLNQTTLYSFAEGYTQPTGVVIGKGGVLYQAEHGRKPHSTNSQAATASPILTEPSRSRARAHHMARPIFVPDRSPYIR
jgi:hypothetical protein